MTEIPLTTRELLQKCRVNLESLRNWLDVEDLEPSHPVHQQLRSVLETAVEQTADLHAHLDLEQLLAAPKPWAHPVQVIERPRAPYERVVEVCGARLETAEGDEVERLQEILRLVSRAHRISEQARQRREGK